MTCKFPHFSSHYSLPEFLKQVEEIKEHQHLLKDLKNSRTLPILQLSATSVVTYDLSHYCLCNMSVVTIQPPKIILPSPTPLIKEAEVFYQPEKLNEITSESTPVQIFGAAQLAPGSFSSECFTLYAAFGI